MKVGVADWEYPVAASARSVARFRANWVVHSALLLLGLTVIRLVTPRDRLLRQVIGEELNDLPSDLEEALADHPLMSAV